MTWQILIAAGVLAPLSLLGPVGAGSVVGMRLTPTSHVIVLRGSVRGTEHQVFSVPDTGANWRWKGGGTVQPLGHVDGTGTSHAVGFIRIGTPMGTLVLTSAGGSLHLALTYPQTRGFAPLPGRATYVITMGTGQYAGAAGRGVVQRHVMPCSAALGGPSCSDASVRTVTYRFAAAGHT